MFTLCGMMWFDAWPVLYKQRAVIQHFPWTQHEKMSKWVCRYSSEMSNDVISSSWIHLAPYLHYTETAAKPLLDKTTMRNVLCQCCNNILWQIPSGLASSPYLVNACREGERDESSSTKWPGAAPRERRMTRSTALLQDLGPLSSLSRIESSRRSNQARFGSLKNALLL